MNGISNVLNNAPEVFTGKTKDTEEAKNVKKAKSEYGKSVGEPKLSDEAKKYYNELKKKYGNYDFVLVSRDEKENAKANAAKYANGIKTVVLIDEDKIERMASDPAFRKKYEDILSGAGANLEQLKKSIGQSSDVQGFGVQINDNGTASYFAVLKKSSEAQKERIAKKAEANKAEKKAEKKKAEKKELEEARKDQLKEAHKKDVDKAKDTETVTVSADSIDELMKKIEDVRLEARSDSVMTEAELMVGQNIDFRG